MSDNPSTTIIRSTIPETPPSLVKKIDDITYRVRYVSNASPLYGNAI